MKRNIVLASVLLCAWAPTVGSAAAPLPSSRRESLHFISGREWRTFDRDPGSAATRNDDRFVGFAQRVCLNALVPANCPGDATLYGLPPGDGWRADLAAIPGATWIWAPGIDGDSNGAELEDAYFSRTFMVHGRVDSGTVYVAVDDYAEVLVNKHLVGSTGSITNINQAGAAQGELASFDISPYLKPGRNVITVHAQNGPQSFSGACDSECTYRENPAGVVFGGNIKSER
jgi:hypothetical protein